MNKVNRNNIAENQYDIENNIEIVNFYVMAMSVVVAVRMVMLLAVSFG